MRAGDAQKRGQLTRRRVLGAKNRTSYAVYTKLTGRQTLRPIVCVDAQLTRSKERALLVSQPLAKKAYSAALRKTGGLTAPQHNAIDHKNHAADSARRRLTRAVENTRKDQISSLL